MAEEKKNELQGEQKPSELEMARVETEFDNFWEEEIKLLKEGDSTDWGTVVTNISTAVIRRLNLPDTEELREHLKFTMETDEGIRSVLSKELGIVLEE